MSDKLKALESEMDFAGEWDMFPYGHRGASITDRFDEIGCTGVPNYSKFYVRLATWMGKGCLNEEDRA